MIDIQLNASGTHHLQLDERHLQTLHDYHLLHGLVDSTGYVTEQTLDRLRLGVRSLIATADDPKRLIDLSYEVLFHDKMKAFGLRNLLEAYKEWQPADEQTAATE